MAAREPGTAVAAGLPPIWLLGMTNLPLGIGGAVTLLITPQLLAAMHTPEPRIAEITSLSLLAGFLSIPCAPILDVRFSRKTYTIGFTVLSGIFAWLSLVEIQNLALLGWLLFASFFAVSLAVGAAGGWLGSLVGKENDARLGAWFTVGNIGGFGVTAIVGAGLMRALPPLVGSAALGALVAAPALICMLIPGPPPDRRLASESFGQFFGDVMTLMRKPSVLMTIVLFAAPAATFALTNTLGGLGREYGASEQFVSLAGGAGVTFAGVAGSLLAPRLVGGLTPRALYLSIGTVGCLFSLALILAPHTPAMFALAILGENLFQAAAFATSNVVIFVTMGKDNPLAATEFTVLTGAVTVPLTYMQVIDGKAFGAGGLTGMYAADAGLGLLACALLALALRLLKGRV